MTFRLLVHVSLQEMKAGPEKDKLLAIPTGLTLQKEDVDLLIAAGRDAIVGSQPLHAFLEAYPLASPVVARGSVRGTAAPVGQIGRDIRP